MKTIPEFLQQISLLQSKNYTFIYTSDDELSEKDMFLLTEMNCAIETGNYSNVLLANEMGIIKDLIYFNVTESSQLYLNQVFGKCRLLATSLDVLAAINHQAQSLLAHSSLEGIAIRIIPEEKSVNDNKNGIYLNHISDLSAKMKKLDNIAIRGIFILPPNMPNYHATKLKEYFSIIKSIRAWLPCTFSYFCIEHVINELSDNSRDSIISNLEVISLLNNTSLYSEFLLS